MRRVTGIGGIFFHAKDPATMHAWYRKHLGIDVQSVTLPDLSGRPQYLIEEGRPIRELIG